MSKNINNFSFWINRYFQLKNKVKTQKTTAKKKYLKKISNKHSNVAVMKLKLFKRHIYTKV